MKPGTAEWHAKVVSIQLEEMLTGDFTWWWLSFCDERRPKGEQFLGACMVRAWGIGTAVAEANRYKINPGGEVQGLSIPVDVPDPPAEWVYRLLTRAECEEFDRQQLAKGKP